MNKNKIIISILITIVLITELSIFLVYKNRKIFITKINEIDNIKISMLKLQNGITTIIKQVPTTDSWIMIYDCDDESVKIYWDEGNRKILMKNIKPTQCTIRFEKSLSAINVVSMYLDNIYVGELDQSKDYKLVSYVCANNEEIIYDILTKDVTIKSLTKNTNCKLYFTETVIVNSPKLVAGMTPVKWNSSNVESTTTVDDPEWYDYSKKKWANAKTEDGSYWVWIPRYAYKITSGIHTGGSGVSGTIDIKFLRGTTNTTTDGTTIETSGYNYGVKDTSTNYFLHPVFQNNPSNGGWDSELTGIWVAKFEASNTTTQPAFKPNATSLRSITVGSMYNASIAMKSKTAYGWNGTTVDTHLMKNTEWGAVAYLAQSKYGANQEIWINNSNTNITGCAGNSVSEASYAGCQNAYNTAIGIMASTTFNITGIYDMSGGTFEYTAGYINNTYASTNGSSIVSASAKYKNVYPKATTDTNLNDYEAAKNLYGDAVYETSNLFEGTNSWNADYSFMPYDAWPWFNRGDIYDSTTSAGTFYFVSDAGHLSTSHSFRTDLIIS